MLFLLSFHLIVFIVQIWLSVIPEKSHAVPFTAIMNILLLLEVSKVFILKRLADFQKYVLIKVRHFNL